MECSGETIANSVVVSASQVFTSALGVPRTFIRFAVYSGQYGKLKLLSSGYKRELFVGITSWNSRSFLGPCIKHVRKTTDEQTRVVVLDNGSEDDSQNIATHCGAELIIRKCTQAEALNSLLKVSDGRYTLLIHADVILLNQQWFDLCANEMSNTVAMVSPEDIGCGLYTRPWGKGMPESSFLFFDTRKARNTRDIFWKQRFKIQWPFRALDLYGDHVTYNLPNRFAMRGYSWKMMAVHPSRMEATPVYTPAFEPKYWKEAWGKLRYGLGNFYSLNGQITHFHNWFDRVGLGSDDFDMLSRETVPAQGGIPKAYLQICSRLFLNDLKESSIAMPNIARPARNHVGWRINLKPPN